MSEQELNQRITQLESQLAFQENTIDSLDACLAQQQQSLLLLEKKLSLMEARMREEAQGQGAVEFKEQELPPHY